MLLSGRAAKRRIGGSLGREAAGFGFCLIAAAAVLMICSMNSFLYPLNPWDDVNCFVTVARGILNGLMPYRDLAEQKGPLLYALHALALWACPGSYHGLYFLEVAAMAAFLYAVWRTLRLYDDALSPAWMALLAALICTAIGFRNGDSAEELCLPLIAISMNALLRTLRSGVPISLRGYVLHGALAGCVLWIKFSLLGLHFAFMATLAVLAVIDDRGVLRALKMCGAFLLGMLLASLPWLIWMGARGALGDMLRVYFHDNLFGYVDTRHRVIIRVALGLLRGVRLNRVLSALIFAGVAYALTLPRPYMGTREKAAIAMMLACTALMVYGGGRRYAYYFMAFAPFTGFALLIVGRLRPRLRRLGIPSPTGARRAALSLAMCLLLLAAGTGYARVASLNAAYIGIPREQTAQGRFGDYIAAHEDRTLLNLNRLDGGFYFAADVLPVNRYFCLLNTKRKSGMKDQMRVVAEKRVHFLVTINETLDAVMQQVETACPGTLPDGFTPEYEEVMAVDGYRLYQRVD